MLSRKPVKFLTVRLVTLLNCRPAEMQTHRFVNSSTCWTVYKFTDRPPFHLNYIFYLKLNYSFYNVTLDQYLFFFLNLIFHTELKYQTNIVGTGIIFHTAYIVVLKTLFRSINYIDSVFVCSCLKYY